jgi:hypothetical protein
MSRLSALFTVILGLGVTLAWPGEASALCRHGFYACGSCGGYGYGYGYYGTPLVAPGMVTPGMVTGGVVTGGVVTGGVNGSGTATAPGFIPAVSFAGMSPFGGGFAPTASFNGFAPTASFNGFAPTVGFNGFAPTASFNGFAPTMGSSGSLLSGYEPRGAILPTPPGTLLTTGHLLASSIYHALEVFGGGSSREGLLQIASWAFQLATFGKQPNAAELSTILQVVDRFLADRRGGAAAPGAGAAPGNAVETATPPDTVTPAAGAGGRRVVKFVVTVEVLGDGEIGDVQTQQQGQQQQQQPQQQETTPPGGNPSTTTGAPVVNPEMPKVPKANAPE